MSSNTVNYLLALELDPVKGEPRQWKYVTTEGDLAISSLSKEGVRMDDHEIPVSVSFDATIQALTEEKCRVKLFLGRSVPYVTGRSTVQQVQVGFSGTVVLESGKPLVVQDDDSQRVTVTLTRLD